jgi:hypothetical protein
MGIAFEMARFELRTVTISPMSISSPTGSSVLPRRASVTLTPSVEAHWPKTRHHAPLALAIARRKPRFADLKLADRIPAIEHIVATARLLAKGTHPGAEHEGVGRPIRTLSCELVFVAGSPLRLARLRRERESVVVVSL